MKHITRDKNCLVRREIMPDRQELTIREQLEARETQYLSQYAKLSRDSAGRKREERQCDLRPVFQRDRDRILHCKSSRLSRRRRYFCFPRGIITGRGLHIHWRCLKMQERSRRALRLNEDLTEAIALGHDLGHTPFGHAGERALNQISPSGFQHNLQSIRVVEYLEKDGRGLNLTLEVLDGIKNHKTSGSQVRWKDRLYDSLIRLLTLTMISMMRSEAVFLSRRICRRNIQSFSALQQEADWIRWFTM